MTTKETTKGFIFSDVEEEFLPTLLQSHPLSIGEGKYVTNTRQGLQVTRDYREFKLEQLRIQQGHKRVKKPLRRLF